MLCKTSTKSLIHWISTHWCNWRALWKGGVCTYFVAIFQVARNPLKFGMLTLCVKKCPFFCHPPPPPSNGVKHTHAQCFSSQRLKSYNVWRWTKGEGGGEEGSVGGEGGLDFHAIWSIFFCFLKKKPGTFLTQNRIGMPNFSGFKATWKIAAK